MPVYTFFISIPAIFSASCTAFFIESTVSSMSTITPFLRPFEGLVPIPFIFNLFPSFTSAAIAHTFVVPISRATSMLSFLPTILLHEQSKCLNNHLVMKSEIYFFIRNSLAVKVLCYFIEPYKLFHVFVMTKPDPVTPQVERYIRPPANFDPCLRQLYPG